MTGEAVQAQFLYIVLSRTNTGAGRLIRLFLRGSRYNHVSAALDGRLYLLYPFFAPARIRRFPAALCRSIRPATSPWAKTWT